MTGAKTNRTGSPLCKRGARGDFSEPVAAADVKQIALVPSFPKGEVKEILLTSLYRHYCSRGIR